MTLCRVSCTAIHLLCARTLVLSLSQRIRTLDPRASTVSGYLAIRCFMTGRFFNLSGIWFGAQCYTVHTGYTAPIFLTLLLFLLYLFQTFTPTTETTNERRRREEVDGNERNASSHNDRFRKKIC